MTLQRNHKQFLLISFFACITASCASINQPNDTSDSQQGFAVPGSFLATKQTQRQPEVEPEVIAEQDKTFSEGRIASMATLQRGAPLLTQVPSFASDQPIKVAVNEMEVPQLAHYVFGELLQLSYVVSSEVERMRERVALNLQKDVSPSELFQISRQVLAGQGIEVYSKDNILYIGKRSGQVQNRSIGIGRELGDLPQSGDDIIQLVPFVYNSSRSITSIISKMTNVQAYPDNTNRLLVLEGNRADIERALQIVNMMDVPHARGRDIRMLSLVYLSPEDLITQIQALMMAEDIRIGEDIAMVPIARLNSVVVYASNRTLGDRVSMWARTLDVSTGGATERFYVYRPQYAKAADLVRSVRSLMQPVQSSDSDSGGSTVSNSPEQQRQGRGAGRQGGGTANIEGARITADETQNAVVIQASPSKYQEIIGLLQQLDRLPGQVAMQVIVAEVDLSSNTQTGIDWFYDSTKNADFSATAGLVATSGQFAFGAIGGDWRVALNMLATRTNVKVLSRPYLVVRDGESASINSGRQVPVLVESVSSDLNPDVSRNSIQYRSTGITLSVTPTINADGLVSLEISQETSNSEGSGQGELALAPVIISRSITTSVLAANGQTVVLGGLIQDNTSINDNKVPLFGSIPILGKLFQSKGDTSSRTELMVLITPRIIRETSELDEFGRKLAELYSFPVEP
tara:strand:- start:13024 stop:15084 length:2061 start_codon:yes stop_codon:yes gene_type:complete